MANKVLSTKPVLDTFKRFRKFPEDTRKNILRRLWEDDPYSLTLLRDTADAVLNEDISVKAVSQ